MLLNKLIEKTAEKEVVQEEEQRYSPAEVIKIAAANLINFVAAVKVDGGHIKKASMKEEINHELVIKMAKLYVDDHYKEAGLISNIKLNPKTPELNQAFSLYEKKTGKNRNDMSHADIGKYVMMIRDQGQKFKGSLAK